MAKSGISSIGRNELALVTGRGRRFVRVDDVVAALEINSQAAAKKLARWSEQGWLRRVRRGLYIPVPVDADDPKSWTEDALVIASEVWSPCYFTGWTTANHWGLTEQVFRTTVLKTACRVRTSTVRLLEHEYLVTHSSKSALEWGLQPLWHAERRLNLADPARTMVDILDAPLLGGGIRAGSEILEAYLDDHDPNRLIEYGDRLGNRAVFKRLGYLVEALHRPESRLIEECRKRISRGFSMLDPDGPAGGPRVSRWNLRANVKIATEDPT